MYVSKKQLHAHQAVYAVKRRQVSSLFLFVNQESSLHTLLNIGAGGHPVHLHPSSAAQFPFEMRAASLRACAPKQRQNGPR